MKIIGRIGPLIRIAIPKPPHKKRKLLTLFELLWFKKYFNNVSITKIVKVTKIESVLAIWDSAINNKLHANIKDP